MEAALLAIIIGLFAGLLTTIVRKALAVAAILPLSGGFVRRSRYSVSIRALWCPI